MRLIKTFAKEKTAEEFSRFLGQNEIGSFKDASFDEDSRKMLYQVWIYDEDQVEKAQKLFSRFEKGQFQFKTEGQNGKTGEPLAEKISFKNNRPGPDGGNPVFKRILHSHRLTSFFLFLCLAVFALNAYQERQIKQSHPRLSYVLLTPVISALLFDTPYALMKYDALVKKYQVDLRKPLEKQNPEFVKAVEQVEQGSFWMGLDHLIRKKIRGEKLDLKKIRLFEKIRQGEIWRIFSPAFLHKDFLHLLFNMLWLWVLGRPIEERTGSGRYLLLVFLLAGFSNLCQYMVSGPNFLGYSGVVMGLVGFIWVRQKIAPWEGYTLNKGVFLFLAAYVFLMLMLSLASFFSRVLGSSLFAINIANTAHIAGALFGAFLARYFSLFREQT